MQALKALVVFMGLLIVVGLGIFAYGISMKFDEMADRETTESQAWPEGLRVKLPPGGRIEETVIGDGRLVLRVALREGGQRLIVFDLETGKQVGAIEIEQGENAQ